MSRSLVLACGNTLRGDDGVALFIAKLLQDDCPDPQIEIRSDRQWPPELAEPISQAEIVIFVDASSDLPPGKIACRKLVPATQSPSSFTHQTSPATLLSLASQLYGRGPVKVFLVTVGASSFDLVEELSEPVRKAVPEAVKRIKSLLSGGVKPED